MARTRSRGLCATGTFPCGDLAARFTTVCTAVRDWARRHPHEYALLYGSPVPGYRAPSTTVAPASRVPMVLLAIAVEQQRTGRPLGAHARPVSEGERHALSGVREVAPGPIGDALLARSVQAWATLFGHVSLEVFGHMHDAVLDYDAHFAHVVDQLASDLGLTR